MQCPQRVDKGVLDISGEEVGEFLNQQQWITNHQSSYPQLNNERLFFQQGLVDTPRGVFFQTVNDLAEVTQRVDLNPVPQQNGPLRSLVEPGDKCFATDYAYFVMEQMTHCVFTEADRLGKRKFHKVGFPGLACKHCYGGYGSGRFFPLTLKTFSDVSKSIHVLRNHLERCPKAPSGLAETVSLLHDRHKDEKVCR